MVNIDMIQQSCLKSATNLKARDVEVEAEGLYDHGCSLPQRLATAGAQLLPTHRPTGGQKHIYGSVFSLPL